jgi:hypothetical protein
MLGLRTRRSSRSACFAFFVVVAYAMRRPSRARSARLGFQMCCPPRTPKGVG